MPKMHPMTGKIAMIKDATKFKPKYALCAIGYYSEHKKLTQAISRDFVYFVLFLFTKPKKRAINHYYAVVAQW